jgi:hypothetical protein
LPCPFIKISRLKRFSEIGKPLIICPLFKFAHCSIASTIKIKLSIRILEIMMGNVNQ